VDPFNINDAALTAAQYLCAAGGNLRTHAGQVAAVLTYNHSDQYVAQVLALADAYHRCIAITGIPTGDTKGKVDPATNKNVPPANPGGPTAEDKTTAANKTAAKKTTTPKAPTTTRSASTGTRTPTPSTAPTRSSGPTPNPTESTRSPTTGSSSSPTPSPTKKCIIWDVLNPGCCAVYA
jgi:hypothetical protein